MRGGTNPLDVIRWIAIAPLAGVLMIAVGLAVETKGSSQDDDAVSEGSP
jgi:hypothetical protein